MHHVYRKCSGNDSGKGGALLQVTITAGQHALSLLSPQRVQVPTHHLLRPLSTHMWSPLRPKHFLYGYVDLLGIPPCFAKVALGAFLARTLVSHEDLPKGLGCLKWELGAP